MFIILVIIDWCQEWIHNLKSRIMRILKLRERRKKRHRFYMNVTAQDVVDMPDREVLYAVMYKLKRDKATELIGSLTELEGFNSVQRVVIILDAYEQLVNKGGIGGFLASDKNFYAPLISFALKAIGEEKHLALFEEYIRSSKIDIDDLSKFDIDHSDGTTKFSEYFRLDDKYHFNEFDEKYQLLPPIENKMVEFVKEHASELFR